MQKIYITNGVGGCGKDTFAKFLSEYVSVFKYSSIDKVKEIAELCGWTGGKTERDRKFLSDLKCLTSDYSDMPFKDVAEEVKWFKLNPQNKVMLIDIREPGEIKRAVREFGAETILIINPNIPHIDSNMADKNVYEYDYDHRIMNNGTLEQFRNKVLEFAKEQKLI